MGSNVQPRLAEPLDPQPELALAREADSVEVPIEMIRKQRTSSAAFTLACTVSGLDDKEIYLSLGIDAGHFSRIKKGDAGFPPDRLADFCQLVKNTVYAEWIAYQLGCTLVQIESETERRLRKANERILQLEQEREIERRLFRDLRTA